MKATNEKIDLDIRGLLASRLTCWHRLTGKESDELVALFKAQPAQKPFTYYNPVRDAIRPFPVDGDIALYTAPPQREWVGLTAEEAAECWTTSATQTWKNFEAKLKERNA